MTTRFQVRTSRSVSRSKGKTFVVVDSAYFFPVYLRRFSTRQEAERYAQARNENKAYDEQLALF